jgi:hypothetical protein
MHVPLSQTSINASNTLQAADTTPTQEHFNAFRNFILASDTRIIALNNATAVPPGGQAQLTTFNLVTSPTASASFIENTRTFNISATAIARSGRRRIMRAPALRAATPASPAIRDINSGRPWDTYRPPAGASNTVGNFTYNAQHYGWVLDPAHGGGGTSIHSAPVRHGDER